MPFTKNNTKYQYLRLNNGHEIFAMVRELDNQLEIHFPMNIMCKPAMSGGVTIHLGPFVPFTTDDKMVINNSDVIVRTSMTDQFIEFYDEACTTWLDMREKDTIEIKSVKEDMQQQRKQITKMIEERLGSLTKEEMWEDYYDEEEEFLEKELLPGPKETIH